MKINRAWAMPDRWTFNIPPIADLLARYVGDGTGWVDPFAGMYSPAELTNDINPGMPTKYHLRAEDFCNRLNGGSYSGIIFDPPYSLRQIAECYKRFGLPMDRHTQHDASFATVKDLLAPKVIPGGYSISFGWNTNGFGKNRGFEICEILLVAHGGHHNDTICTVERKIQKSMELNV